MSTPEAIRLADELDRLFDQLDPVDDWRPHISDAGDELRRLSTSEREGWRHAAELEEERARLSALNAELLSMLKDVDAAIYVDTTTRLCLTRSFDEGALTALIAKAEGGAA